MEKEYRFISRMCVEPTILPEENEEEIWKKSNIDSRLMISSFGRAKNIETGTIYKGSRTKNGYVEILMPYLPGDETKQRKIYKIHQLVADAFCEREDGPVNMLVDHKDGCKYNNYYKNLRYLSLSQNSKHLANGPREKRIDKNNDPVGLIDKTTNKLMREFRSIYQAHKITGLNEQEIASNIHGKRRPFKIGYFVILEQN